MASAAASSRPHTRKWGPGTAAIVRLLIATQAPLTQVAIARVVGVSQPRASQVLQQLVAANAVTVSAYGYRGKQARLLDLYAQRARPQLVESETFWYSTRPLVDQANRITTSARRARVKVAFSADLAPDLLVPWRHPTLTVVYAGGPFSLKTAGLVPAEGRGDASIALRWTSDSTLFTVAAPWPAAVDGIPLADPVQQWWDLRDLGGEDRTEAADRLRRAIITKTIPIAA
jgi:hypothetical protein